MHYEALTSLRITSQRDPFIVTAHHANNPRVFGSVLDVEDTELSDLDLLVDTTPQTTLFDIAKIQNKLHKLLHVSVDVLTPNGLPERLKWLQIF